MELTKGTIIYLKPGIYQGFKTGNVRGRQLRYKYSYDHGILAIIDEQDPDKDWSKDNYKVNVLVGEGIRYKRNVHSGSSCRKGATFLVNKKEAIHDGDINRVHRKLRNREDDLRTNFIFKQEDGTFINEQPARFDIDKMVEQKGKAIYYVIGGNTVEEKDLIAPLENKTQLFVIAREIAKKLGTTITNREDFEDDTTSSLNLDLVNLDLYREIQGRVVLRKADTEAFKQEFIELCKKFNVDGINDIEISMPEEDDWLPIHIDEDEVQVKATNMGLDIQQILRDGNGMIQSKKFGM